ncbi:Hypothetical protein, putative [Bodo saltans]|uniref:Uncharacterized protein n=1 Tax=Bodo saltans TaxID=75058 RepID=A0A0S4J6H2_BODSA|nr:Hypothetical protein, putative [Bodo saltans]|eukprot:CUG87012.1 Hypothetical protein, putative [Bodo saltans]
MKTASKKPLPAKDALQSDSDDDSSADDDVESCYHTRLTEKKQREIKTAYGPYEKYGDCEKLEVACVKAIRSLHPHGKKSDSTHFAHKVAVRLIQEVLRDKRSPRISLQVIFGMVDILSDGAVGSIVAKNHNKVDSLVELLWRRCIEGRFDIHSHDAALAIAEYVKNNKKALKACNIRNGAEFKAWAEKHMDEGIDVLRKMRDGDVCPEARGLSAFSRDAARLLLRAQRSTKALVGL